MIEFCKVIHKGAPPPERVVTHENDETLIMLFRIICKVTVSADNH